MFMERFKQNTRFFYGNYPIRTAFRGTQTFTSSNGRKEGRKEERRTKKRTYLMSLMLHKRLLDEVEHDIMNYQNRGVCYLPKPKAEADNTDTRF